MKMLLLRRFFSVLILLTVSAGAGKAQEWTPLNSGGAVPFSMAPDGSLITGTSRSTDNGATWMPLNSIFKSVYWPYFSYGTSSYGPIYTTSGPDGRAIRSTDWGATWDTS